MGACGLPFFALAGGAKERQALMDIKQRAIAAWTVSDRPLKLCSLSYRNGCPILYRPCNG